MKWTTLGIDLAKSVFQLHGVDTGSPSKIAAYPGNTREIPLMLRACGG